MRCVPVLHGIARTIGVTRIVLPFNISDSADQFIEMLSQREARVGTIVVMYQCDGEEGWGGEQLFNVTQIKYSCTNIDNKSKY